MLKFPNPLQLDSSGSAVIRMFGKPFNMELHLSGEEYEKFNKFACPNFINNEIKCRICGINENTIHKKICLCWDIKKKKFALLMANNDFFKNVWDKCLDLKINSDIMRDGMGPDIIITKQWNKYVCEIIPESLGIKRADNSYTQEQLIEMFFKKSIYKN